jgi:hypothetical protein
MEADLFIAGAGAFIIVMGGLVAVAGVHRAWTTSNAPNPALGNVIVAAGALVILLGVALAMANVVVWMAGRRRGTEATVKPGQKDDLLESIRDDGHRDQST